MSLNTLTALSVSWPTQDIPQKDSTCTPIYLYLSKKKKKKKFLTYSQSSMSLRDGAWEVDIDRNTTTFQTKGKIFTSVNTLHILQALAKSALKILHLHLLLTSNIHKGYANTKPFQELMFPLESISFIWKGENKRAWS